MPPKRRNVTASRAAEVIDVAADLFYSRGYEATSVQDVADAMGMLKGSLYYYIKTKEDLLFAIIVQAHEASLAIVKDVTLAGGDSVTQLRHFAMAHLDLIMRERIKIGVFLHDFRSLGAERRKQVASQRSMYFQFVVSLIRGGQADGQLEPSLDPELAALGVLGILNWVYEWYRPDGPYTPDEIKKAFVAQVVCSVSPGLPRRS